MRVGTEGAHGVGKVNLPTGHSHVSMYECLAAPRVILGVKDFNISMQHCPKHTSILFSKCLREAMVMCSNTREIIWPCGQIEKCV